MAIEANVGALHGNLLTALGTSIVSGEYPPGQLLTLDGVSALAGTVVDVSGRSLAFAVMVDKVPIGLDAPAAEDVIGVALYRCGCAG